MDSNARAEAAFITPMTEIGTDPAKEEKSLHVAVVAYSKAASARAVWERRIGGGAAVASSIVTLSIFGSLSASADFWWKFATGILSVATAALVSLDKFSGKAPSPLLLRRAAEYSKLYYKLRADPNAFFDVGVQHAELIGMEPTAPDKYWREATETG